MAKTIIINGESLKLRYSLRALFIFESITGKAFSVDTLTDNYVLLFSMLLAANPDTSLTWDKFIDALDARPQLFEELTAVLNAAQQRQKLETPEDDGEGEKKN